MLICEGCGKSFETEFRFCSNCGRAVPEPNIGTNSVPTNQSMIACPKCHSDAQVVKVSAILQRDIHTVESRVPLTDVHTSSSGKVESYTYWRNVSSTQISSLAQMLLPPPPPVKINFGYFQTIVAAVLGGLAVLCCFPLLASSFIRGIVSSGQNSFSRPESIFGLACLIVTAIFILWLCYYYVSKDVKYKKDYPSHRKKWEEAMLRHDQLYYCFRDDCIFIPGENTFTAPSNMMALIKWQPYSSKPPWRLFQY